MITYLYGTDKYRINGYLRQHAPRAMVGEEALKTKGLFDQDPVILYLPDGVSAKAGELPDIPSDVEVFVVSEKKPKGKKNILEFNPLKGSDIPAWIKDYLQKKGYSITQDALLLLSGRYVDTWQTALELEKLCSYTYEKKRIEKADLDAISYVATDENIFKLTDAIAHKQKGDAVILLDRQLASGADPYYLFSMVVFQFRNMLTPGRTGVHPYAAQKARQAAQRFNEDTLKTLYRKLHQLELDAKSGMCDMEEGLYRFIFSL